MQYGLTLNTKYQPFYPQYPDKMCAVVRRALQVHPRTLVVRIALWPDPDTLLQRHRNLPGAFMEALKASLPATGTVDYLWTRDFIMWSFFWIRTPSGMAFLNIPGSAPWSAGFVTPGAVLPDYPAHRSISRCVDERVTISFC